MGAPKTADQSFLLFLYLFIMSDADAKTPLLGGTTTTHHASTNTNTTTTAAATSTTTTTTNKPPVSRPKYKRRRSSFDASTYNSAGHSPAYVRSAASSFHERLSLADDPGLSLSKILGLTICMAGVQFTCKSIIPFIMIAFTHLVKIGTVELS